MQKYNGLGHLNRDLRDITLYSDKTITRIEVSPSFLNLMDELLNENAPNRASTKSWIGFNVMLDTALTQDYQIITRDMTGQECEERDADVKEVRDLMNA